MSVQSELAKTSYTLAAPTPITAPLEVPFYFLEASHLKVILIKASSGIAYTLALTTSYTVVGAGLESGLRTVTLTGATVSGITPAYGDIVTITRNVPLSQTVDYVPNAAFPATTHERALDKLTMAAQQIKSQADTALRLEEGEDPLGAAALSTVLTLSARKGNLLQFNATTGAAGFISLDGVVSHVDQNLIPEARAARDAAQAAQAAAELAQGGAETAQSGAEAAQAAAELAETNAETAEANAETAQAAAEAVLVAIDPLQYAKKELTNVADGGVTARLIAAGSVTLAKLAADALTVIQNSGFDTDKYQGLWTPSTNTPTIPVATGNTGKWYFVAAAGTATGNAAGTYAYGDCILSNGTSWLKRPAPPTVIPDDSVSLEKLTVAVKALMASADDFPEYIEIRRDSVNRTYLAVRNNGKTWLVLDDSVVVNSANLASGSVSYAKLSDQVKGSVAAGDDYTGYIEVHLDASGRKLWAIRDNGTLEAKFPDAIDNTAITLEVQTARGSAANLNARISESLTPAGRLNVPEWGRYLLRSFAGKARRLAESQADKLSCLFIGDSWTHGNYFTTGLFRRLYPDFGGAGGGGFCGFAFFNDSGAINGCADPLFLTGSRSVGNWTQEWNVAGAVYALDGTHIKSSTVGASVTVNVLQAHTSVRIHYRKQAGGGTFRWRVDAGAWTNVSTDEAAGYGLLTISVPNAACTINIEVQSAGTNGVILNGLDAQRATGVVFHKCGQSGGTAQNWLSYVNDSHFRAGVGHLAPDLCVIMFGTNEQNGNITPDTLKANVLAVATKVREQRPLCDFLFMCPSANGLTGKTYTMAQYSAALYDAAVSFGAGFISHQQTWGDYDSYKYTADPSLSRNWFGSDAVHPSTDGGRILVNTINNFVRNA